MPTFETLPRFTRDYAKLTPEQRTRFRKVLTESFIPDLAGDGSFRPGLRVKGVQAAPGVFEMTWAPDGRATFQYGHEVRPGETHIVWRRVGTHDIFDPPPGP
jgi:hypothetical protein